MVGHKKNNEGSPRQVFEKFIIGMQMRETAGLLGGNRKWIRLAMSQKSRKGK